MRTSRPCSHLPGDHGDPARCPRLTQHQSGLCEVHLRAQRKRVDDNRPNAHQRGYDTAHRAASQAARDRGQRCQVEGCRRSDVHRDHVDGNPRNNDPDNIAWLCQTHHSAKTLSQDVERDERGRILPSRRRPDTPKRPSTIRAVDL